MTAIGVHVCERCGAVYRTIGDYLNCVESHDEDVQVTWEAQQAAQTGRQPMLVGKYPKRGDATTSLYCDECGEVYCEHRPHSGRPNG